MSGCTRNGREVVVGREGRKEGGKLMINGRRKKGWGTRYCWRGRKQFNDAKL